MKRYAISAGHGLRDPGAVNGLYGIKEHGQAYLIAWELRDMLEGRGHKCEFISCFQALSQKIKNVNELHRVQPFDQAIEIHFNSARRDSHGTEVLYYSNKQAKLAESMSAAVSAAIETHDRGAKKRTNLGWLTQTLPPALIVESLFISHNLEAAKLFDSGFHRKVAQAIAAVL